MKLVEDMDKRVRVKAKKQSFVLISKGRGEVSNFFPRHRPIFKKKIRACGPSLVVSRSISSINVQPQLSESIKNHSINFEIPSTSQTQQFTHSQSTIDAENSLIQPLAEDITVYSELSQHKIIAGEVSIYLQQISEHLFLQQTNLPFPFIHGHTHLASDVRMKCLQLILSFSTRYSFSKQTIFLALSIFHRIALSPKIQNTHQTTKAIASLFVAAKYEEVAIPRVELFAKMDPYSLATGQLILSLQSQILLALDFNLGFPTVLQFIDLLILRYGLQTCHREKLIDLSYISLHSPMLWQDRGSILALACIRIAYPYIPLMSSEELSSELSWRTAQLQRVCGIVYNS